MKILGILICGQNPENNEILILKEEYFLDSVSYFARGTVKGSFKFVCRNSLKDIEPGTIHKVKHEEHFVYINACPDLKAKVGAYVFCDAEYPPRVAKEFLRDSLDTFVKEIGYKWIEEKKDTNYKVPKIEENLVKYQNPKNADKLILLESNLEETKEILHDNLEKLLARQGDLDALAAKSTDLNIAAKQMYKQSKKANKSCCAIF